MTATTRNSTTTDNTNAGTACKDFPDNDDQYHAAETRAGSNVVVGIEKEETEVMMMEDVELGHDANAKAAPADVTALPTTTITTTTTAEQATTVCHPPAADAAAAAAAADTAAATDDTNNKKSYCSTSKMLIGLLLLTLIVFVIIDSSTTGHIRRAVQTFLEWIEDHAVAGIVLFIMVYFIATVFFIPGSLLTLGAGFVFASAFGLGPGVALGTLVVFVGAASGALAAFCLSRYLLREAVTNRLSNRYAIFQALDQAVLGNGLKIFILLRLSPVVPFSILNYVAGVMAVSMRDYTLALFAILPGTILYVFLGASAGSLTDTAASGSSSSGRLSPTVTIVIIVVGVVLGVAAVYLTIRYARQELNRILAERNNQPADEDEEEERETVQEDVDEESPKL